MIKDADLVGSALSKTVSNPFETVGTDPVKARACGLEHILEKDLKVMFVPLYGLRPG